MTTVIDPRTVTAEDMEKMSAEQLTALLPQLVNAFDASRQGGRMDISRIQLRNAFYNRAANLDRLIIPLSHSQWSEWLSGLGPPVPEIEILKVIPAPVQAPAAAVPTPAPQGPKPV